MGNNSRGSGYMKARDRSRNTVVRKMPFKREPGLGKRQARWALFIAGLSFVISTLLLFASDRIFKAVAAQWAFFVVLGIILIGIVFDAVGVAVTAAEETPFHAMGSKKQAGARQSIMLIRHASKVSSICNDVVGDICSVVSGAAGTAIALRFINGDTGLGWVDTLAGALIAAMTVGGKAMAKNFGIQNSNYIVYYVGRFIAFFNFRKANESK